MDSANPAHVAHALKCNRARESCEKGSTLRTRPEWHVIGEASDGLEAVQKAQELRPDVIVLDIGLPSLNGLDAARRIRTLAPESTILFLTQESSVEVAQAALSLGALGYVVKTHAGTELIAALEAACQGKPFVSRELAGHSFTDAQNTQPCVQLNGSRGGDVGPR